MMVIEKNRFRHQEILVSCDRKIITLGGSSIEELNFRKHES